MHFNWMTSLDRAIKDWSVIWANDYLTKIKEKDWKNQTYTPFNSVMKEHTTSFLPVTLP